jgi:hypothetical protein
MRTRPEMEEMLMMVLDQPCVRSVDFWRRGKNAVLRKKGAMTFVVYRLLQSSKLVGRLVTATVE